MSLYFRSSHVSEIKEIQKHILCGKEHSCGNPEDLASHPGSAPGTKCLVSNTVHFTFSLVPGKPSHREGKNGIDGF